MLGIDSSAPTFANTLNGQVNLRDAVRRQIDFVSGGKQYKLAENPAVLLVRYAEFLSFAYCVDLHLLQT